MPTATSSEESSNGAVGAPEPTTVANTSFGAWLRRRRHALGFTQKTLGQRVSYTESMVREIEAGRRVPAADQADRLADALGIPPEQRRDFVRWARGGGDQPESARVRGHWDEAPDRSAESASSQANVDRSHSQHLGVAVGFVAATILLLTGGALFLARWATSSFSTDVAGVQVAASDAAPPQATIVEPADGEHVSGEWIPVQGRAIGFAHTAHLWIVESRGGFYWPQREALWTAQGDNHERSWEAWARVGAGPETGGLDIQMLAVVADDNAHSKMAGWLDVGTSTGAWEPLMSLPAGARVLSRIVVYAP